MTNNAICSYKQTDLIYLWHHYVIAVRPSQSSTF